MVVFIGNSKESTEKLLNLINEFGKITGYNNNIRKSIVVLHISNEHMETDF